MAQKVLVQLVDDVDQSAAVESVTFGLDGVTYEIDLSEENAAKLRAAFTPWTTHARRTGKGATARPAKSSRPKSDARVVREWAAQQGLVTSARGRISAEVRAAYAAAHA